MWNYSVASSSRIKGQGRLGAAPMKRQGGTTAATHSAPAAGRGGGIKRGRDVDFLNQTSCSKPCVIQPTDDGVYSRYSIQRGSVNLSRRVSSIPAARISFASGASGASLLPLGATSCLPHGRAEPTRKSQPPPPSTNRRPTNEELTSERANGILISCFLWLCISAGAAENSSWLLEIHSSA